MGPIPILLGILAVVTAIWFGIKMKKSLKYDQLIKDITEPVDVALKSTNDVMKDISVAEKALQATAKIKDAEADKATKESATIGEYLTGKGVVKPKTKGKETDNNEVAK